MNAPGGAQTRHVIIVGNKTDAKDTPRPYQFTHCSKKCKGKGKSQSCAQAVKQTFTRIVLACKSLSTSENYAVNYNERDVYTERLVYGRQIGFHKHLQY